MALDAPVHDRIGPEPDGVHPFLLLGNPHHGGRTGHFHPGQGVGVFQPAGKGEDIPRRVHQFHLPQHFHVIDGAVVVERIGPCFLVLREQVHVPSEEEQFLVPVVPAVVGGEHVVVLPHVGPIAEIGRIQVAAVFQAGGLHEGGVHVHVHLVVEHEQPGLGVVGTVQTLDDLPVLVPHGRAVLEDGDGVLGIIVQVPRAEGILVLVLELDDAAAELRQVVVHHVLERARSQPGPVLDDLDMPHGVDDVRRDVPQGRIAEEVGIVVQEAGRAHDLTETLPVLLDELGRFRADQRHERVLLLLLGPKRHRHRPQGQCRQEIWDETAH